MDTDLRDQIDRSFGDGPPPGDLTDLLVTGRRALRRRRLVEAGSMVAVATVAVTGALLVGGGSADRATPPPAHHSTPTATPTTVHDPTVPTAPPEGIVHVFTDPQTTGVASLEPDGRLHVKPGVRVLRTIDNPLDLVRPSTSAAAVYEWRGKTYWYLGYYDDQQGGASAGSPVQKDVSFLDWVAENATIYGGTEPPPGGSHTWPGLANLQLVRFAGHTEQLDPLGDVTMVRQHAHPDVGASFAGPRDQSAVAEVVFQNQRYFVLARRAQGSAPQYIAVHAAPGRATLAEFLDFARTRYAEGGGGLL